MRRVKQTLARVLALVLVVPSSVSFAQAPASAPTEAPATPAPAGPSAKDKAHARELYSMGQQLFKQGDFAGAESWLKRAITPLDELDNLYRSVYLIKLADFASARTDACTVATLYFLAVRFTSDPVTVLFPPDRRHAEERLSSLQGSMSAADCESSRAQADTLTLEEALHLVFPSL